MSSVNVDVMNFYCFPALEKLQNHNVPKFHNEVNFDITEMIFLIIFF